MIVVSWIEDRQLMVMAIVLSRHHIWRPSAELLIMMVCWVVMETDQTQLLHLTALSKGAFMLWSMLYLYGDTGWLMGAPMSQDHVWVIVWWYYAYWLWYFLKIGVTSSQGKAFFPFIIKRQHHQFINFDEIVCISFTSHFSHTANNLWRLCYFLHTRSKVIKLNFLNMKKYNSF